VDDVFSINLVLLSIIGWQISCVAIMVNQLIADNCGTLCVSVLAEFHTCAALSSDASCLFSESTECNLGICISYESQE